MAERAAGWVERLDAAFRALAHRAVAVPLVYDTVQRLAGGGLVDRRLDARLRALPRPRLAVDLGGGTGGNRSHLERARRYLCLDIDRRKLSGFRAKEPAGLALQGDATRAPLRDGSADLVLLKYLAHHLEDGALARLFAETARLLSPEGRVVLVEPVWAPRRWPSRLLWHYDRGDHPRGPEALRAAFEAHFQVESWECPALYHAYVIAVGTRADAAR